MAVRIRLKRMGAKKKPYYRIVVADSRSARDGRVIETLGQYDPLTNPSSVSIDGEKARTWLENGAQPSDTVRRLLSEAGVFGQPAGESASEDVAQAAESENEG